MRWTFLVGEVLRQAFVSGGAQSYDPRCSNNGVFDAEWDECSCKRGFSGDTCEECSDGYAGWPHCILVKGSNTLSGWSHLCPEVNALRESLPSYVRRMGRLYAARQSVSKARDLQQHDYDARPFMNLDNGAVEDCDASNGTIGSIWRLKVDLEAPGDAPAAFKKHHRVVLVFGRDWPMALPSIRFVGKIKSAYTVDSGEREEFAQDVHTSEAGGLLLRRLQEGAGGGVDCMWRQTGGCARDGSNREPEKDLLCSQTVPVGASGFCDCDGDGAKASGEPGYGCDASPGTCDTACARPSSGDLPRHNLRHVIEVLHRSLGGPLQATDSRLWRRGAEDFSNFASTVLKYERYGRKNPELFQIWGVPLAELLDPQLRDLLRDALSRPSRSLARTHLLSSGLIKEIVPGLVFSFRVFSDAFCEKLMEEIRHFYASKLPAKRPNSMNNYGIILNDIGLEPLIFTLQDAIIQPLAATLLPEAGSELESHHAFTIRYRGGEDTHLDVHTDDSDITFNVNIYSNYSGAPLVFCGINGAPDHRLFKVAYQHELGHAVLHLGRHRHGAEDITSGERMNLVVWSYSHNFRTSSVSKKVHQREQSRPDKRCVSYTHDRDFGQFRAWPEGKKERHLGAGWCPPRGKEYQGFVPDVSDENLPRRGNGGQ